MLDILVDRKGGVCVVTGLVRRGMSLSPLNAGYNSRTKKKKKKSLYERISGIKHEVQCSYSQFSLKLRATESGFGPQWERKKKSSHEQGRIGKGKRKKTKQRASCPRWPLAASSVKGQITNYI